MQRLILLIITVQLSGIQWGWGLEDLTCVSWMQSDSATKPVSKKLEKTSFDENYYRTDIGDYAFGVDVVKLEENQLGYVIHDNSKDVSSYGTVGMRSIANSNVVSSNFHMITHDSAGRRVFLELSCSKKR